MRKSEAALDTHVLIWMFYSPERLSAKARAALERTSNQLTASHAALWEIAMKTRRGRLAEAGSSVVYIMAEMEMRGVGLQPIELRHILASEDLPLKHSDPFDRIQIAQAQEEAMTFVTADKKLAQYAVPILW